MGKAQWILLSMGIAVAAFIYFGMDTRPPEAYERQESRSLNIQRTSAVNLVREKLPTLPQEDQARIRGIYSAYENSLNPSDSIAYLKELSGAWYEQKEPVVAGHYAELVASMDSSADAWSMAGTTYALAFHMEKVSEKELLFAVDQSRAAFEKAITLDAENVNHRINLALTYVEQPPQNNPMKGIQMLLSLNEKYPESATVLYQLGRLGMQTGQYEKAIKRLEKAIAIEPMKIKAHCLLADAYAATNQSEKAKLSQQKCKSIK
jgi:tetratricopeptide (TPR) repeat protein